MFVSFFEKDKEQNGMKFRPFIVLKVFSGLYYPILLRCFIRTITQEYKEANVITEFLVVFVYWIPIISIIVTNNASIDVSSFHTATLVFSCFGLICCVARIIHALVIADTVFTDLNSQVQQVNGDTALPPEQMQVKSIDKIICINNQVSPRE